jgi:hypothetical protein
MDVVVAIPAFNEARTVGEVVEAARRHAPVLVIDDGSTDGTAAIARAAGASVVRHDARRGKGAALVTALTTAREGGATRLVTLDADGQHDPGDIPALLAASRATPHAIIIGSRLGDDHVALPRGRAAAIQITGFWLNWIAGTPVADTQSGFRVYPIALFDEARRRGGRFVFETEVLVEALRRGWQVREVPIRVVPYATRASRFHPVTDGLAITVYVTGKAVARWGGEIVEGARAVVRIFSRERRTARHARIFAKVSPHTGTPTWGAAIAAAMADEVQGGVVGWWHAPRARRARRVALATVALPALLIGAGLAVTIGDRGLGMLERLVRALYDQRALPTLTSERVQRMEEGQAWVPAPR